MMHILERLKNYLNILENIVSAVEIEKYEKNEMEIYYINILRKVLRFLRKNLRLLRRNDSTLWRDVSPEQYMACRIWPLP